MGVLRNIGNLRNQILVSRWKERRNHKAQTPIRTGARGLCVVACSDCQAHWQPPHPH